MSIKHTSYKRSLALAMIILPASPLLSTSVHADGFWEIKPYFGLSELDDTDANSRNIGVIDGNSQVELDTGFTAGLGLIYHYNDNWAAEVAWEYRSNDSTVTLADGQRFSDGNYASSLFFTNGYYLFAKRGAWQPYLGAGLSWAQEIDIDLETANTELSYSGQGDLGFQVFGGTRYEMAEHWGIDTQLRWGKTSDIDLSGEGVSGELKGLDYQTITLQVGLNYQF